jgi:hypothetical protein
MFDNELYDLILLPALRGGYYVFALLWGQE